MKIRMGWKSILTGCMLLALVIGCFACTKQECSTAEPDVQEVKGTQTEEEPALSERPNGAQAAITADLPKVGDKLFGFTVTEVTPIDVLGATGVTFTHDQSGATLLYIAASDTNRSFDITFRTPALDEKGKPHVFEHMTICGSQKYPDANMFFPIVNQTYSTYVNAYTYQGMTSYPIASLSEEQLLTMMDYYLSGVFMPLLYSEPRLVAREAWRYELVSESDPIDITGTVYSEMQGTLTIGSRAIYNGMYALFDNSPTAHISGGVPEAIRTLTYDELIAFHDAYYHPSNALIMLYGELDYARFLDFIDSEYLSKYEKKEIAVERGRIEPYKKTVYKTFEAPIEEGMEVEDGAYLLYGFGQDGLDMRDTLALDVLASVMLQESSPLMRLANERLPNASVTAYMDYDLPVPALMFHASGVNAEDQDTFVALVDEAIEECAETGVSADELDSVLAISKLALLLTPENSNIGVSASLYIAQGWAYFDTLDYYEVYERMLNDADVDYINGLIKRCLKDNTYRAVALTVPKPGLAEENAAKLQKELDDKKAAMTDDEIATLVETSETFAEWSAQEADESIISPLLNITVDRLPEETVEYVIDASKIDDVTYMTAKAEVGDVGQTIILLDGSVIPIEQLQDAQIYLCMLGELDTLHHTREELSALLLRYLGGFNATLIAKPGHMNAPDVYAVQMAWIGLSNDYEASVELLRDIYENTQVTDTATIRAQLVQWQTSLRTSFDDNALLIQRDRSYAAMENWAAYNTYLTDVALYGHLGELITEIDNAPDRFIARLESAKSLLMNKHNAIVQFAGNDASIDICKKVMPAFFEGMMSTAKKRVDYSPLRLDITREALINNATVHMNLLVGRTGQYSGKSLPIMYLIDDMYMLPKLRNAMGAYGAYCAIDTDFTYLYTYRDPNIQDTYDIFCALPEYLRTADITQEDVDRYIVGSYTTLSQPVGMLTGALNALALRLQGYDDDWELQLMREAKMTTVDDVRNMADQMENIINTGVFSSSGSQSIIDTNAELFDSTVRITDNSTQEALE